MTQQEFEKIKGRRIAIIDHCGIFRIEELYEWPERDRQFLVIREVKTNTSKLMNVDGIKTCMFVEENFDPSNLRKGDAVAWTYEGERCRFGDPQPGMIGIIEDIPEYEGAWTPVEITFYNPVETHATTATHYYGANFEKVQRYDEVRGN